MSNKDFFDSTINDLSPAEQTLLMQSLVNNFKPEAVTILMTDSTAELKTKGIPQFNDVAFRSYKFNKTSYCNDVIDSYKKASNNLFRTLAYCSLNTKHLCATFCALHDVFSQNDSMIWFGWRNGNELLNTANFCRLLFHLIRNGFFVDAHWQNVKINATSMSYMLAGYVTVGSDIIEPENVILPDNKYVPKSLRTYISRDSVSADFENYCKNLTLNKYLNRKEKHQ